MRWGGEVEEFLALVPDDAGPRRLRAGAGVSGVAAMGLERPVSAALVRLSNIVAAPSSVTSWPPRVRPWGLPRATAGVAPGRGQHPWGHAGDGSLLLSRLIAPFGRTGVARAPSAPDGRLVHDGAAAVSCWARAILPFRPKGSGGTLDGATIREQDDRDRT